jgi:hypothetical protein
VVWIANRSGRWEGWTARLPLYFLGNQAQDIPALPFFALAKFSSDTSCVQASADTMRFGAFEFQVCRTTSESQMEIRSR